MSDVNRIKAVLAEQKVSSKLLAIYMKKTIGTVSRWCNNKSQPHVNDLNKIAEFLKVDIRELLVPSEWELGPSPAELLKMQKGRKTAAKRGRGK
jgi:transcriptional regulator with XRE-family HTH domain